MSFQDGQHTGTGRHSGEPRLQKAAANLPRGQGKTEWLIDYEICKAPKLLIGGGGCGAQVESGLLVAVVAVDVALDYPALYQIGLYGAKVGQMTIAGWSLGFCVLDTDFVSSRHDQVLSPARSRARVTRNEKARPGDPV